MAAGANVILIPERPFDIEEVVKHVESRFKTQYAPIVVVAEGAHPKEGQLQLSTEEKDSFGHVRLGGVGQTLSDEIEQRTGLATRLGVNAIESVHDKSFGKMVALQGTDIVRVDLSEATDTLKTVPLERYQEAETFFG